MLGIFLYTIYVLCWYHFGVLFVSFWCHFSVLGGLLATLGPPRGPLKGPSRKSNEKVCFWSPFGRPKGCLWGPVFDIFCVFSLFVEVIFWKRFLERFCGLWGPPPTMKLMVLFIRNHHFNISTLTSKMTGIFFQWVPFWHPLGSKMQQRKNQKH